MVFFKKKTAASPPKTPSPVTVTANNGESPSVGGGGSPSSTSTSASSLSEIRNTPVATSTPAEAAAVPDEIKGEAAAAAVGVVGDRGGGDIQNNDHDNMSSAAVPNLPEKETAVAKLQPQQQQLETKGTDETAATSNPASSSSPSSSPNESGGRSKSSVVNGQRRAAEGAKGGAPGTTRMNTTRRRKRGRVMRMACVQDELTDTTPSTRNSSFAAVQRRKGLGKKSKTTTTTQPIPVPIPAHHHHHLLPEFQYETILTRRAIRKLDAATAASASSSSITTGDATNKGGEIYGDVSLGMKLGIVAGHVIVQSVNALADGRASPAQLSGVIHRGDVLLEINGKSLVHVSTGGGMGADSLMGRLKPLSEPTVVMPDHQASNTSSTAASASTQPAFARHVRLRFSAGQGLEILRKSSEHALTHAAAVAANASSSSPPSSLVAAANDVFSLFPMVDQLSGMPLMFEDLTTTALPLPQLHHHQTAGTTTATTSETTTKSNPEDWSTATDWTNHHRITEHRTTSGGSSTRHRNNTNNNNKHPRSRTTSFLDDDDISNILAEQRESERNAYNSEFFEWNTDFSTLMRREFSKSQWTKEELELDEEESKLPEEDISSNPVAALTHQELMELGRRAARGAKLLSAIMEKVDRGSDRRSIYSLSATLSLYSRASTRRRYVLDSQAMPINIEKVDEDSKELLEDIHEEGNNVEMGSADGDNSGNEDDEALDGDELLLRLAARDEIWRTQVIEFLEKVIQEAKDAAETKDTLVESKQVGTATTEDMDAALANELGNFLFGENMAKVLKQHKKPQALPPEEITALLFDLTTKVSSTVPDQIKTATGGSHMSHLSSMVPFTGMKPQPADSNVMMATRYLLHDVLPVWLKTFRPLPWDQRRVLWPLDKAAWSTESTAESTMSDDSLTIDDHTNMRSPLSMSMTAATSGTRNPTRKKKNLREQIEDIELNVETRSETCFLTTFYFTQQILPQLSLNENDEDEKDDCEDNGNDELSGGINTSSNRMQEAVDFVQDYGAYLKMQTCLSYAAVLEAQPVIDVLLNVSKYDPRHREVSKQFGRASALVFYDPSMLSAIVQRLHEIRSETNADRRITTIELCAAAYPDVRPWQVKRQCHNVSSGNEKSTEPFEELYYIYLSMLLHPTDGNDVARHDPALVKEWCELSVVPSSEPSGGLGGKMAMAAEGQRRKNFMTVASRASSEHLSYFRDFEFLLDLSMQVNEHDLSLDLATELLEDPVTLNQSNVIVLVVSHLRQIGCTALDMTATNEQASMSILKRIIRLYNKASTSGSTALAAQKLIDVPHELLQLLEHIHQVANDRNVGAMGMTHFVRFLSQHAVATDLLEALSRWFAQNPYSHSDLYPVLQTILHRGLQASPDNELSGSLLRLRQARARLQKLKSASIDSRLRASMNGGSASLNDCSRDLWKNMSKGALIIAK